MATISLHTFADARITASTAYLTASYLEVADGDDEAFVQGAGHPSQVGPGRAPLGGGTEFVVEEREEGVLLRPLKRLAPSRLDEVAGRLRKTGPARTIGDMDGAITAELKARRDRGRY